MKSRDFRAVLRARPFCPFSFPTGDGETYAVEAPDDAWLAPDGDVVAVSAPGGVVLVDIEWITRVAFAPNPPGGAGPIRAPRGAEAGRSVRPVQDPPGRRPSAPGEVGRPHHDPEE